MITKKIRLCRIVHEWFSTFLRKCIGYCKIVPTWITIRSCISKFITYKTINLKYLDIKFCYILFSKHVIISFWNMFIFIKYNRMFCCKIILWFWWIWWIEVFKKLIRDNSNLWKLNEKYWNSIFVEKYINIIIINWKCECWLV